MAFSHGLKAEIWLSGTNLKAYITEIDPSFEREMAEMAHLGDPWKTQLPGLRVASFSVAGDFDPELDALVWAMYDGDVATQGVYYPSGSGTTPAYAFQAFVPSFKPGPAGTSDAVKYSFDLACSGTVTRTA
jgi:hypothetical protein